MPVQFKLPEPGTTITHNNKTYHIHERLGSGFFSFVHKCSDEWGNKLVAKILKPEGSYIKARENWNKEIGNLFNLRHPYVTYIYDAFECENVFYLIVEECAFELKTLILDQNPVWNGRDWIRPVSRCILQALDFFHDQGYAHKDLHAGNIFGHFHYSEVNPSDAAICFKVGDLGITNMVGNIDIFNTVLARWMLPPEFLDPNRNGVIDHRVDIYHVGLILLSLELNQIPNFSRQDIMNGVPREIAESLQSPYGPVIARSLRRRVHHRTGTALQLWREIDQVSVP